MPWNPYPGWVPTKWGGTLRKVQDLTRPTLLERLLSAFGQSKQEDAKPPRWNSMAQVTEMPVACCIFP